MNYPCELVELAAQPTVAVRTYAAVQDLPQVLGKTYGALAGYLTELGEPPVDAPYVGYFNMDMANLDIEIGLPVARQVPGRSDIQASEIPGGPAVRCLYVGPYDGVGSAYEAMNKWVAEHGYATTDVSYEFYLNAPEDTPPADLQTRIVMPLRPKG